MMARFEREVAALHGCAYGLMCNSGTSALQVALAALRERHGWQDGDEVLVPAITFVATVNVVLYNGLTPIFVDVHPRDYTMDPARVAAAVTPRTRAIVPVHVAGLPCDMGPIVDVARAHGLRLVEDSCEAMFVTDHGRPVGSFGDVGCFSTYIAHLISTGVGGLCVTNDAELHTTMKSLVNHGRDSVYTGIDDDRALAGERLFRVIDGRFSFVRPGFSFRATELEAALGLAQLEAREALAARRQAIAGRLTAGLADLQGYLQLPRPRPGAEHGYMMYPLAIIDHRIRRDALVLHLEERGIETRYLLPLINQPIYRKRFGDLETALPVAAWLNGSAFFVGCHPEMSEEEADYMVACFHDFFGTRR
jgi:CDP-6-deoxy-D-xylo-4-hexulose-3-dehydrase